MVIIICSYVQTGAYYRLCPQALQCQIKNKTKQVSSTHKICTPLWDRTRDLWTHPSTLPSPQHILHLCPALNIFFNSAKPSTHSSPLSKPSTRSTLPSPQHILHLYQALHTFFTSASPQRRQVTVKKAQFGRKLQNAKCFWHGRWLMKKKVPNREPTCSTLQHMYIPVSCV